MNYNISEYIIRAYVSDGEVFIDGKILFQKNKVIDINIDSFDESIISAEVDGERGKKYSVKVFFDENGNIYRTICTCCKGKCRHIAAVLFEISGFESGNCEKKLFVKKGNIGEKLIDDFRKFNFDRKNLNVKRKINVYPFFRLIDDNKCGIGFFAGNRTHHKIDNIYGFFMKMSNGGKYNANKNISFGKYELKQDSFKYLDFIQRQINNFYDFSRDVKEFFGKDYFVLNRSGVDDFFRLAMGSEVYSEVFSENGNALLNIEFTEDYFDFNVFFEKDGGVVKLCGNDMDIRLIEGIEFGYIIKDNRMFRIEKEKFDIIKTLNDAFMISKKNEIVFLPEDLDKLAESLIYPLEKNNLLRDAGKAYEVLDIAVPEIKFYLDNQGGTVFLEVEFVYAKESGGGYIFQNKIQEEILNMNFEYEYENGYSMSDDEFIFELYDKNAEKLKSFGEVFLSENFKKRKIKIYKNVLREVKISGGLLEIDFDLSDFDLKEAYEILNAYKIKKRFYKLKDGAFINLETSSLEPMLDIMDGFDLSEKEMLGKNTLSMPIYNVFYLNDIITKGNYSIKTNDVYEEIAGRFKDIEQNGYSVPKSLDGVLRDYQKKGFFWLKTLVSLNFGGILADDMGLGKTVQIISLILSDMEKQPSIVVCPTSLVYNWKNEVEKFAPSIECLIVAGSPAARSDIILKKDFNGLFITTYDLLKRDIKYYDGFNFRFIIADEAQNIKNSFTQNARAVKTLKGDIKFALTGTPVENSLAELWSVFDFVMPGYLGGRKHFRMAFENPIVKYENREVSEKLKRKIMPFILRRVKTDVLKELPEKTETVLYCDMSDKQVKLYNAKLIEAKHEIERFVLEGNLEMKRMEILAHITRLRQLCCHPSLFIENYSGGSGKLSLAIDTIKSASEAGHRILLFSQFTSMLNIIKDELENEGIPFFYLDGAVPSKERLDMTERFNMGEKEIFLISLKAGGTGLNLTGADVVIHFEPWWNPAVMDQASDRAHRFGQMKNVHIFYMVAKNSIEEKIIALQNKKKQLVKSVISDDGEIMIGNMTRDDILSIFESYS